MPVKIPENLPARAILEREGVMVMGEDAAARQDIRPLQIGLLNLMPDKARTETQFARLIGATPLQIELTLIRISNHVPRHTGSEHMENFYTPWDIARARKFDGLVITGAPIERLPFHAVTYWDELTRIFDWTDAHVHSVFAICWGAQAMLHHFHGLEKRPLARKALGCFRHRAVKPNSPYLRGFSDVFIIPVSRWTCVDDDFIRRSPALSVLADSSETEASGTGVCLVEEPARRALYMFNHLEYDTGTLAEEYRRDKAAGIAVGVPVRYFPKDDPEALPENRWRSHAHLLFGNWINEVYQSTPFDLSRIGAPEPASCRVRAPAT